jgi:hypothetical protein
VDTKLFLDQLSAVDQAKYKSKILRLDCTQPMFYWIFRNCDFTEWNSGKLPVLWLSGPTECSIDQVSSDIVRLEMDTTSGSQHIVLYFFCSSVVRMTSSVTILIHTFLHQFIRFLSPSKRRAAITAFLRSLVDWEDQLRIEWEPSIKPVTLIKKILNNSNSGLWNALQAALDTAWEQKLSIIIDGLDRVEELRFEFIRGLRAFIKHLLERPSKPKVLLTSGPQADIKEMLDGLLCITYDRERKGLSTLNFLL